MNKMNKTRMKNKNNKSKIRPFTDNRIKYIINLLSPKNSDKVLNVGISNIPEIEIAIEDNVKECWTIDIDKQKLKKASKYLKKTKLICEDIDSKPLKKNYFDKVIIIEVLEHLDSDITALKWINSILKKNGSVIIGVPNKHPLHIINPVKYFEHKRHYSNEEITNKTEENGFKIMHLNVVENWSLLANLYIHFFFKFILRKTIPFNTFKKSANKTYMQENKSGMDIIIKAKKIRDV
ncbi:methyltransferase domain-containing protein [Candidatus Pacearchaeota archaeon]|nr:methyltransferase domain-containing protein [Candidatus Pacearchaeota archaeon]